MARCITYRKRPAGGSNNFVYEFFTADVGGGNQSAKPFLTATLNKDLYDSMTAAEKTGTADLTVQAFIISTAALSAVVEVT